MKYPTTLAEKGGKERFDAESAKAIKGSDIAPRAPRQPCATAANRLTKARARKLITALVGHPWSCPLPSSSSSSSGASGSRSGRRAPAAGTLVVKL